MEALDTRNPPPTGYMYGNKTAETRPHGVYIKEKGTFMRKEDNNDVLDVI